MEMPVCIHCRRVFMAVLWVVKRVFLLWWWSCNSVGGKSRAWACFCFVLQATTEHYRWWHWPRTWIYYTYQYHQLPPIIWSYTVKNNSVIFKSIDWTTSVQQFRLLVKGVIVSVAWKMDLFRQQFVTTSSTFQNKKVNRSCLKLLNEFDMLVHLSCRWGVTKRWIIKLNATLKIWRRKIIRIIFTVFLFSRCCCCFFGLLLLVLNHVYFIVGSVSYRRFTHHRRYQADVRSSICKENIDAYLVRQLNNISTKIFIDFIAR